MMRPGSLWTATAAVAAAVSVIVITASASTAPDLVLLIGIFGFAIFLVGVLAGSAVAIGFASAPILLSALLEAVAADEPVWLRSLAVACLWFVTSELGWEAIERRVGDRTDAAVSRQRLQEVGAVLAVTLGVSLLAMAAQSLAPLRTLPLQVVVVCGFLAAFVITARRMTTPPGGTVSE